MLYSHSISFRPIWFQVEALQEGISRLKGDIKEAKGRGDERERHQREQLEGMEKRLSTSMHEADSAETKLNLMEGVISKLKVSFPGPKSQRLIKG